ncbi:MFS transporter [Arthrobacter sp. 35W]|uniref:MFS transporter n=1 Tax=Arthrobacter sp. 35W TaxID=1132441 RepID=UPI0004025105|nr:MFS transporter [Arthrobacter sp. 35W]
MNPQVSTPIHAPTRSTGRYAKLPQLAGRGYIPLGLFARIPLAMLIVGTLTLVTAASGSYAIGGFAAGAVGIGSAIGAPLLGFLADKLGQRRVLLASAVLNALAVAAVVLLTYLAGSFDTGHTVIVLATALVAGSTSPQVGPMSRVRWMALSKKLPAAERGPLVDTALSLEGTADEITFVLGPALVGVLASLVAPWLPLALAAVMTLVLVSLFAVHPTEKAVTAHRAPGSVNGTTPAPSESISWLKVGIPVAAMLCMGMFFGSSQTAISAFMGVFASVDQTGLIYAVMGFSSAFTALSVAYWPASISHPVRWVAVSALMVLGAAGLLLADSVPMMIVMLLFLGLSVGPTMVTIFSIGGMVAPARWMGTVMTALASGIVAGTALGAAIAGSVAQDSGYHSALLVPVAAAGLLFILGAVTTLVLRRR